MILLRYCTNSLAILVPLLGAGTTHQISCAKREPGAIPTERPYVVFVLAGGNLYDVRDGADLAVVHPRQEVLRSMDDDFIPQIQRLAHGAPFPTLGYSIYGGLKIHRSASLRWPAPANPDGSVLAASGPCLLLSAGDLL